MDNQALFLLALLIWFQQIDDWRDARPILERLSEMRRLDSCLICELGNALLDGEHARDLLGRQLKLPDRRCEQTLAGSIQRIAWSWPAACFGCAGDQLLVGLSTPPAP